jgi:hypothetical protein
MAVGLLTLILMVLILRYESRSNLRWMGILTVPLIIGIGLLGALTVKLNLPAVVSIFHVALAHGFLAWMLILAHQLRADPAGNGREGRAPGTWVSITTAAVFIQIVLGAWYRHSNSGWALAFHASGAAAVTAMVFVLTQKVAVRGWSLVLACALVGQLILGPIALAVTPGKLVVSTPLPLGPALLRSAHGLMGTLMWVACVLLCCRRSARVAAKASHTDPVPVEAVR